VLRTDIYAFYDADTPRYADEGQPDDAALYATMPPFSLLPPPLDTLAYATPR